MSKYWFRKKIFGFGVTPLSWEGWLITVAYVGLIALSVRLVLIPARPDMGHVIAFVGIVFALTAALLVIAYTKLRPDEK